MRRAAVLPAASLLAALSLAPAQAAGAASRHVIAIKDMRFGPVPGRLRVGDTIVWKNSDIMRHTATARNKAFDLMLQPGESRAVTLRRAGHIGVFCRYHPDMTLTLIVEKAGGGDVSGETP